MTPPRVLRSLGIVDYRRFLSGLVVTNLGIWIQRTAQDWLVLTELTDHDATALGACIGLQFLPQLVLVGLTGYAADRLDRRRLLLATQTAMLAIGSALALLTVTGLIRLWMVMVLALLLGLAGAFDTPARLTFGPRLVPSSHLPNAVSLASASHNAARLIGPGLAGLLLAALGTGWVLAIGALGPLATIAALRGLRRFPVHPEERAAVRGLGAGFRYVLQRSDLVVLLTVMFVFGTLCFNFPVFTSTMATIEFRSGPEVFGVLSSVVAIGSLTGTLVTAASQRPRLRAIVIAAALFAVASSAAALMPTVIGFAVSLVVMGFSALTIMTTANAYFQLTTPFVYNGRVLSIYLAVFIGSTPLGALTTGWVADTLGPRWALGLAALGGAVVALVLATWRATQILRERRRRAVSHASTPKSPAFLGDPDDGDTAPDELALDIVAETIVGDDVIERLEIRDLEDADMSVLRRVDDEHLP